MKFGDKLIALRKKSGMSQEDLAGKLNVSRQSVSKWESNNTYPETDKIVQICNLFDCSMDDLINDNISSIDEVERKEKNTLNIALDSFLEFITKTVDMFSKMSFGSGLKCLVEIVIVGLLLALIGSIFQGIIVSIISKLIKFLPDTSYSIIITLFEGIISIIWFAIALIILVHTFKIRYLDYFDNTKKDSEEKSENPTSSNEKVELKKDKEVIIRDPNNEPFAFLSVLSKLVIIFIKFIVFWIMFGFAMSFIGLIVLFVFLIPFALSSLCFVGGELALIGGITINALIVLLLFNFIFNLNSNVKVILIIFISSLILVGVGGGIATIGFKNITIENNLDYENKDTYTKEIDFKSNLYINNTESKTKYIIDNSIENNRVKIQTKYSKEFIEVRVYENNHTYDMAGLEVEETPSLNLKKQYDRVLDDLKNNIIRGYSVNFDDIYVYANEETINNLEKNLSKMYLFDKKNIENGFEVSNMNLRVEFDNYGCEADYNAETDNLSVEDDKCVCNRTEQVTSQGTKTIINCEDE